MQREDQHVRDRFSQLRSAADLPEMRALYDELGESMGMPPDVSVRALAISGRPAEWLTSANAGQQVVLYLHGGGYSVGSLRSYRHLAAQVAKAINGRTLLLDYRLAPEHVFPAALEDALAAYSHLLAEEGVGASNISFMGDSAGGNLVMATLLAARDRGLPLPASAVCISPWVDYAASGESTRTKAEVDPIITPEGGVQAASLYFAGTDMTKPPAAILQAQLGGLPPLLIQVGSDEVLLDDSTQLAVRAAHDEVAVTLEVWPRMIHVFQFFYPVLETGRQAIDRAAAFIARHAVAGG